MPTGALTCAYGRRLVSRRAWIGGWVAGLLWLLALWAQPAWALVLRDTAMPIDLSADVEWLEDATGSLTVDELRADTASRFRPLPPGQRVLNVGYTASVYWLRVKIGTAPGALREWLLQIPYGQLSDVQLYAPGRSVVATGSHRPLDSRTYFHRHFVFPVVVTDEERWLHLRVATNNALTVPVIVWPPDAFRRNDAWTQLLQFGYFGGLLCLVVYCLVLYLTVRDRRFLYFSCYAGLFWLAMFAGNGFGRLFLWPDAAAFDDISQSVFLCLAAFFAADYSRAFLRMGDRLRSIDLLVRVCGWALLAISMLLAASLHWPVPVAWLNQASLVVGLAMALLVLVASVVSLHLGIREARLFLVGWSILWMGAMAAGLRILGVLPSNALTYFSLQIASAVEMLLLAIALADLMRNERHTRERAQVEAFDAQSQLVTTLRASEGRLEAMVADRTAQLLLSLREQKATHDEYVRFGSLIAHEFRNPLGKV